MERIWHYIDSDKSQSLMEATVRPKMHLKVLERSIAQTGEAFTGQPRSRRSTKLSSKGK